MDLEGFEPSPATVTGCYAAVTPQAHEPKLTSAGATARRHGRTILGQSFVLEQGRDSTRRDLAGSAAWRSVKVKCKRPRNSRGRSPAANKSAPRQGIAVFIGHLAAQL
jgi:hypothetical protein